MSAFGLSHEDRYRAVQVDAHNDAALCEYTQAALSSVIAKQLSSSWCDKFLPKVDEVIMDSISDSFTQESELAAIIRYSLTDPGEAGNRLKALHEKEVEKFVHKNHGDVLEYVEGL